MSLRDMEGASIRSRNGDMGFCTLCGGWCIPLPQLGPCGMVSDGHCVPAPLAKMSCLTCGCVSHVVSPTQNSVRTTFGDHYALSHVLDGASLQRGAAYVDFILGAVIVPAAACVLDVGCGNGALLLGFAERRPDATLAGLEAAKRPASAAGRDKRITITRGFAEDLPRPDRPFDLVCSVNVIEHSFDPRAFLEALARQVSQGGTVAVICPRGDRPNLELLFYDHIHTFAPAAMVELGRSAGLELTAIRMAPDELGEFQLCVFAMDASKAARPPSDLDPGALAGARLDYLRHWSRLDDELSGTVTIDRPITCFGASEAAALLRAYAPRIWSRAEVLLVDEPSSAWDLGRPVRLYGPRGDDGPREMLMAVHPGRQAPVGERLARDGYLPIFWSDAIRR